MKIYQIYIVISLYFCYEFQQKTFFDTFNKKIEQKQNNEQKNTSVSSSSETVPLKNATPSHIITIDDDESSPIPEPPKKLLAKSSKVRNKLHRIHYVIIILVFITNEGQKTSTTY